MKENQNIEWKASWRDEYLKWICGFANAQGGVLEIGKNNQGEIIGVANAAKLLGDLPKLRRHIGVVFQDFKLLDKKTIFENVAFAMEVADRPDKEIQANVSQVLEIVGLAQKADNYPPELSGGEKQRTSIARALVHRPEIIIADEPTGNLDIVNSWEIIRLLTKINQYGTTIILATHNREIVNSLNRRVVTLDGGRVVRDQKDKGRYLI